jgi:hypothetical protein
VAVGDSNLAGVARVAFEAQTGEFNRDVSRAEATYKSATEGMSDSAIRLELANERLRRSLAKGPAASREQARALLQVRQAERDLTQETDRNTRALQRNQRELDQSTRRATAGSGAFRGLGRNIAFAAGTFLGASGLVYGLRSALKASSNLNEQVAKSRVVFGANSREVEAWAKNALGLANDQALETAGSIGALLRPLGLLEDQSSKISTRLTDLGTDLASFYNTDVQSALDAIRSGLVGEIEPLRRYGVILSATKVEQAAMAATGKTNAKSLTDQEKALARVRIILTQTKLAHGDYARTIGGSANQERELQKNWRNTQILLGQALQPAYNDLLRTINRWLGEQKNQERIQRTVNRAVEIGTDTFHAIRGAIEETTDVVKPLVDGLGGVQNTLKLLAGAWLLFKTRSILGFTATASASRTTSVRMIADATAAGRAWDWATRPRVMSVTTVGGGGVAPTGPAPAPTKGPRRIPNILGVNPYVAAAVAGITAYNLASGSPSQAAGGFGEPVGTTGDGRRIYQRGGKYYVAGKGPGTVGPGISVRIGGGGSVMLYELAGQRPEDIVAPGEGRQPAPPVKKPPASGAGSGNTSTAGAGRRTIADIQLDLARARTTTGTADDERLVRELRERYRRQAAVFESRKNLTKSQRATLERLYGDIASATSELEGYEDEREQALTDRQKKAAAKRKARADARERQRQKEVAEFVRQKKRDTAAQRRYENIIRERLGLPPVPGGGSLARPGFDPDKATAKNKESELERAERARADAQLRNEEFRRLTREFGSNVMTGSQPGTAPATVIVNQSFKAPTTDRHREARMAWNAARTQFYG